MALQNFGPHQVGEIFKYTCVALKTSGAAGVENTPVTYTADDPTLAAVTANHGVANDSQCIVHLTAPGLVTITPTSTNEASQPYSTPFTITIEAAPVDNTDHFGITESV